ncbi:hypothetical protein BpHYR1_021144 [Brachionus plicatilis]|uniref:Uncharacterized protein n=1 Tax=Brachionus plicatilis TaxID=10195 RepID=A0A3M7PCA5_BRAPC|nr:hypothetical protein BpHYR1_021144 [Brachionus plicatilis]
MICLSVNKLDFDVNSGVSLFASIQETLMNIKSSIAELSNKINFQFPNLNGQNNPQFLRLFFIITSVTLSKTNLTFSVSVAHKQNNRCFRKPFVVAYGLEQFHALAHTKQVKFTEGHTKYNGNKICLHNSGGLDPGAENILLGRHIKR